MNDNLLNNISLALAAYEYWYNVEDYAQDHEYTVSEAQLRLTQCHTFKDLFNSLGFTRAVLEQLADGLN